MTISSTTNRISYTGNGNVDTYAYTFRIVLSSDLLVTVRDTDGVETTLTINTDYTVTGAGDSGGGNVVLVNNSQAWLDADGDLKSDYILTIRRVRPLTQITDIRNQGEFFPEVHEDAMDNAAMVDQQLQDAIDRSVKLPETVDDSAFDPTLPADIEDNAGAILVVNATGDGWDLSTPLSGNPANPQITGNLTLLTAGAVIILTSPDGTKTVRLGVDNNGNFGDMS